MSGKASEHPRSDFLTVVKGEHNIGKAFTFKHTMRTALTFSPPANGFQC